MKISSDFKVLLRSLNAAGVRYLIVGGYAVMVHTEPHYTKDLDLRITVDFEGEPACVLSRQDVLAAKIASGRPRDRRDARRLRNESK